MRSEDLIRNARYTRTMKRNALTLFLLFVLCACGGGAKPASDTSHPQAKQASNEDIAKQIRENDARRDAMGSSDNSDLTLENNLKKTILYLEGKQGLAAGMPAVDPASTTIAALRAAGVKLQLVGVQGQDVANLTRFLQLKDNTTELMTSTKDAKKRSELSQLNVRIVRLRQQVDALQNFAGSTNFNVQTSGVLTPLVKTASMISVRKRYNMEYDDADYARVKKLLEQERRKEAIAASGLGLLAATQAAINDGTDATAIDKLGDKLLEALPMKVEIPDQEAKDYVKNFKGSVATVKSRYEDIMRKTLGEAYDRGQMKMQVSSVFATIERAEQTQVRQEPSSQSDSGEKTATDQAAALGEDAIRKSMPGLNAVEASARGVQAAMKGDAKGALQAAMQLANQVAPSIPGAGPIIVAGLGLVGKLFG
jgi:hypothetical protein